MANRTSKVGNEVRPIVALAREDIGNLDAVLRGYYRGQIKSLEKRKDRRLARQLLQDHLILPKSRQRTSKDAAYIKEMLGIDFSLLDRLEESRLIRRIQKSGNNPIYEVSHDTLVEPILAERNNRLAIKGFLKKAWKYGVALLLLWFLLGMFFENTFSVLPEPSREARRIDIVMDKQVVGLTERPGPFILSLPPLVLGQDLRAADSLLIRLPLDPINLSRLRQMQDETVVSDTIAIVLASPIEVPVRATGQEDTYHSFSNVLVPLADAYGEAPPVYARVSGALKMTGSPEGGRREAITRYQQALRRPIEIALGDTLVQAGPTARTVPVNVTLQLSDLFDNEEEKNNIRTVIGDRPVRLNYVVRVGAAPAAPPPPARIEMPAVQGIEVQYSDGSKRFIPNTSSTGKETIHVVAAGETLFSIAKKYNLKDASGNTSIQALMELNGLQNTALKVGQRLRIPEQ